MSVFFLKKKKKRMVLSFRVGGKRWSVIAFKHWGFPECLGRTWFYFCGARSLRSVWQNRLQQISGKSSLCSTGQFSTTLSMLMTDILSTCRFCAWSYFRELKPKFRSGKVDYFPWLFACACDLLGGRGGRVLTFYRHAPCLIPPRNGCGNCS